MPGKAAEVAVRGEQRQAGDRLRFIFHNLTYILTMDSQPPQKPWERRVPGAMAAPVNYR